MCAVEIILPSVGLSIKGDYVMCLAHDYLARIQFGPNHTMTSYPFLGFLSLSPQCLHAPQRRQGGGASRKSHTHVSLTSGAITHLEASLSPVFPWALGHFRSAGLTQGERHLVWSVLRPMSPDASSGWEACLEQSVMLFQKLWLGRCSVLSFHHPYLPVCSLQVPHALRRTRSGKSEAGFV